jgi:peptide-methionine (S)-S-oxide reductase
MIMKIYLISLLSLFIADCNQTKEVTLPEMEIKYVDLQNEKYEKSVFASGCFWCVEAVYESVEGVAEAISGYAGGTAENANYSDVSAGRTDHAEAVEVYYDPEVVSYNTLLEVFFGSHDPTTLNRQGPDSGRQYRSTIFYKNEEEKKAAEAYIAKLKEEKAFDGPITTTLEPLTKFYNAEDYHQDYEKRNPNQPYVRSVSIPRLKRFQAKYPHLLKKDH